jgi:regulatory protein
MPETVTSISIQKKNKNRFNIFINGHYTFSLSRELAESVKVGDCLTETCIESLKQADVHHTAYHRALYFLNFRPRSRMEIKTYLDEKDFPPAAVKNALARLEAAGYINDYEFARLWIENRRRLKPKGIYAMNGELRQKGIDVRIIKDLLTDFDEVQCAWAAIAPRLRRITTDDRNEFNKKIYGFLSRRGFSYDICKQICDQAWEKLVQAADEKSDEVVTAIK